MLLELVTSKVFDEDCWTAKRSEKVDHPLLLC